MKDATTNALLDHLMKCIAACETCADACLDEPDVQNMANCIRLDRDCADACTMAARFVARDSANADQALQLCIALCKACEKECRSHDHDHCRICAEACHTCHTECEAYAATAIA